MILGKQSFQALTVASLMCCDPLREALEGRFFLVARGSPSWLVWGEWEKKEPTRTVPLFEELPLRIEGLGVLQKPLKQDAML